MLKKKISIARIFVIGFIAITINTIILKAAPLLHIEAESGGLLKLFILKTRTILTPGLLLYLKSFIFFIIFHYATGMAMVLIYVFINNKFLPGKGLVKGSVFSLIPWAINAFIVLPLLGQGIAGINSISTAGILYFFIANWAFGAILGLLYEKWQTV
ncbi:MAG: hypothetical protein K2W79_08850 [Hydrotalea flava]|uniref:hypothetical protein n=1 Tax=Hydrotalea TaxID=1004300 RepID=UPI0010258A3C|nr:MULTISPECIES: hypothetical protein [Hydrotalea]MBY0348354.1 hypothetical protein [Hydrotalea flava]RWZ88537.1 MAG: hypothetical protein EO766_07265 [Hydrotalea sp. AMD]